jgi:hypothetical protein
MSLDFLSANNKAIGRQYLQAGTFFLISISMLLVVAGASLLIYTAKMPIYTDKTAPDRLSAELEPSPGDLQKEEDARFNEWFSQLRTYETPYKKLSNLGRGLFAAGIGLLFADGFWVLYHRFPWMRTTRAVFLVWLMLWAVRIPLSVWYYSVREQRFDYPVWGDSIAIGIFGDWITWIIGAALSSLVLAALLQRHKFPDRITLVRPSSILGWLRAVFFACWIAFLANCLIFGIPEGDEGAVLTSMVATVILLVFLSADEVQKSDKLGDTPIAG